MGRQPTIQWGFDQKPGGEVPQIVVTTNHVGADVLICPSSTARQTLSTESTSGASLRWADEDICPYVVRGDDNLWDFPTRFLIKTPSYRRLTAHMWQAAACRSDADRH